MFIWGSIYVYVCYCRRDDNFRYCFLVNGYFIFGIEFFIDRKFVCLISRVGGIVSGLSFRDLFICDFLELGWIIIRYCFIMFGN